MIGGSFLLALSMCKCVDDGEMKYKSRDWADQEARLSLYLPLEQRSAEAGDLRRRKQLE